MKKQFFILIVFAFLFSTHFINAQTAYAKAKQMHQQSVNFEFKLQT